MEPVHASAGERRFAVLLAALLALLLLGPLLQGVRGGRLVASLAGGAVPLAAVYAVAEDRRHLLAAGLLAFPAVAANLVFVVIDASAAGLAAALLPLAFFAYVTAVIGRHVFGAGRVTADTLSGAACVYLLLGWVWWFAYIGLEIADAGAFAGAAGLEAGGRLDLLYFSFVTLTTLGYGDVTPVSAAARSLAVVEAVVGVLFLAILIARLVGVYAASRERG